MSFDSTVIKTITCFVKRRRKKEIDQQLLLMSLYCQDQDICHFSSHNVIPFVTTGLALYSKKQIKGKALTSKKFILGFSPNKSKLRAIRHVLTLHKPFHQKNGYRDSSPMLQKVNVGLIAL